MIEFFTAFAGNTWILTVEMAPYLIFGFFSAGFLFWIIRPEAVQRMLGKPGLSTVIKACLIGVPMPLCSCSVIPIAASFRKSGASRGATAGFISSTPQTGVDSIFATYSLMGGLFTTVRIVVAFISGIVTGFLIELFCKQESQNSVIHIDKTKEAHYNSSVPHHPGIVESFQHGFIKLPSDLAIALIIGLILAGLISTLLPANLFEGSLSSGPAAFLLATLVGLPLYICATASIPMAYALITAGLSPGAALVFLIVGPATNTATIMTIWKIIGRKATGIYLASLLIISWLSGWAFNASIGLQAIHPNIHEHETSPMDTWQHVCGIALIVILALGLYDKLKSNNPANTCCGK